MLVPVMMAAMVATSVTGQRNAPRRGPCALVLDLLPDDYTADEATQLIEDFAVDNLTHNCAYFTVIFQAYLIVKKRTDRGDFVDFDTRECSPKLAPYKVGFTASLGINTELGKCPYKCQFIVAKVITLTLDPCDPLLL